LDRLPKNRLGKQASHAVTRFLIAFCIGVVATLVWQSDVAKEIIASSFPRLGRPAAPVVQATAAKEEFSAISFGLAGVRQRVDQIAAQIAVAQERMTGDITNRLQAVEQDVLEKISAPQPRPAAAPAHKPVALAPPLMLTPLAAAQAPPAR
jgi:hypothetical protein